MRYSESIKPISYLKTHASEVIRDVSDNQKTLIITHNGEAKVVVQDVKVYEKTQESIALLKMLALSGKNLKSGKHKALDKSFNDVRKRIEDFKRVKVKFKVNIISDAEEDLFEIYKYAYVNDSEEKAEFLYSKLYEKCQSLQEYAKRGHKVPELEVLGIDDFLELHYKPYRVIYQIIKDEVYIHCILDGRREMQILLHERLIRG